ncbi:MAG: hypothetical protein WBD16_13100 [Pyrinomonadaceae bacterium]
MKTQISFMTGLFKSGVRQQATASDRLLGEDIALWFINKSKGGEFTFGVPVQDQAGWSEMARADGEEFKLGFEIAHATVGSDYAEWHITIGKGGVLGIFGSKDSTVRGRLCDHIHNVLRDERQVREVQWGD